MKRSPRLQYAALPYRTVGPHQEVLLITSRETRRWIIPKGWAEKGIKPHDMAAREAFEEAGVRGRIDECPFGSYRYEKRLGDNRIVECKVTVFLLEVEQILADWPEKHERERSWLRPSQAAMLSGESGLTGLLLRFGLPPVD
jgi:8-oxo-dGTP pyrophosphatase MutT (NUDIX family)